jgi:hypothetical protein
MGKTLKAMNRIMKSLRLWTTSPTQIQQMKMITNMLDSSKINAEKTSSKSQREAKCCNLIKT